MFRWEGGGVAVEELCCPLESGSAGGGRGGEKNLTCLCSLHSGKSCCSFFCSCESLAVAEE